jgi:hypothetical protein
VGVQWSDITAEDVTPKFLEDKTLSKLKGRSATLENIRGLGPSFASSCIWALSEVRCQFWLWTKGEDEMKGIELHFLTDEDHKISGAVGTYVYSQRTQGHG